MGTRDKHFIEDELLSESVEERCCFVCHLLLALYGAAVQPKKMMAEGFRGYWAPVSCVIIGKEEEMSRLWSLLSYFE